MWQIYYLEGAASQLDKGKLCLPFSPFNWLPSVTFIKTLTFNVNFIIWAGVGFDTGYTWLTLRGWGLWSLQRSLVNHCWHFAVEYHSLVSVTFADVGPGETVFKIILNCIDILVFAYLSLMKCHDFRNHGAGLV